MRHLLIPFILLALVSCVQVTSSKLSTFGSAKVTVDLKDDGSPKRIVAESDGTNVFRIFHDAISAVRGIFGGGQDAPDIHINMPGAPAQEEEEVTE